MILDRSRLVSHSFVLRVPHSFKRPSLPRHYMACNLACGTVSIPLVACGGASQQLPGIPRPPSTTHDGTISPNTKVFLAAGKAGIVYGLDDQRVLKEFHDAAGGKTERFMYQRLGSHPNIAKLLGTQPNGSILLERGTPLRTICRASSAKAIPIQTKIHWLREAAEGYQYLHNCNIVHADVGCGNLILTRDGYVKLIDFEGCSIDGGPADSCYEWFSYCPSIPRVSQRTDVFAFGCTAYEVLTGRPPHHELEASDEKYRQVENAYANKHFPDVTNIALGHLIQSCWYGDISSMSEVIQRLEDFRTRTIGENCLS